jgi:hypothetical protein
MLLKGIYKKNNKGRAKRLNRSLKDTYVFIQTVDCAALNLYLRRDLF